MVEFNKEELHFAADEMLTEVSKNLAKLKLREKFYQRKIIVDAAKNYQKELGDLQAMIKDTSEYVDFLQEQVDEYEKK